MSVNVDNRSKRELFLTNCIHSQIVSKPPSTYSKGGCAFKLLTDEITVLLQGAPSTARSYCVGNVKVLEACVFILRPESVNDGFAFALV